MNGEESGFYSVLQASGVLGVTPEEVHELIDEGELEARRDEEADHWLIRVHSVHARLKGAPTGPHGSDEGAVPTATPATPPDGTQVESRGSPVESVVLVVIGVLTLLAAAYTLLPVLVGGESVQPKETAAGTGGARSEETTAGAAAAQEEKTAPATTPAPAGWVSAVGDSVMLGAMDALQQEVPDLALLDAQGSRQPSAAIDVLRRRSDAGQLGRAVIVDVGNNGPFAAEQFEEMMRVLAGVRKVLIVNLTVPADVPGPIAVPNNAVLANEARRYPNTVFVDWQAASAGHPEFFGEDGTHLTPQGAQAYAELIAAHLGDDAAAEGSVKTPGPKERTTWGEGGTSGECVGPSSWCAVPETP
jgi:hypothetical protein